MRLLCTAPANTSCRYQHLAHDADPNAPNPAPTEGAPIGEELHQIFECTGSRSRRHL
jgi:hypothetical protein